MNKSLLINTTLQWDVWHAEDELNRFNGFGHSWETVETVSGSFHRPYTLLKQGVNESGAGVSALWATDSR